LVYIGRVGTGFDERTTKAILAELQKVKRAERPVKEKPIDDVLTVWLEPQLVCEVQYLIASEHRQSARADVCEIETG
jgi:bifunctional non-homologous end joining protein LigD